MENQLTPYQEQMANLYAEASANKYKFAEDFKKCFYPIDPFDGEWVSVHEIPIEVFRLAALAERELDENLACWLDVFDDSVSQIAVKIDTTWIAQKRKNRLLINDYIVYMVRGDLTHVAATRDEILRADDLQLHQDLIEADELLFSASVAELQEEEDDGQD